MDRESSALTASPAPVGTLPGVEVVARIRRLLVTTLLLSVLSAAFLTASRGMCSDAIDGRCAQLDLRPNPFLYVLFAIIVVIALSRVVARAQDVAGALRTLDRAALAIGILTVAGIVISHAWFWSIPFDQWGTPGGVWGLSPFPFGAIEFTVSG